MRTPVILTGLSTFLLGTVFGIWVVALRPADATLLSCGHEAFPTVHAQPVNLWSSHKGSDGASVFLIRPLQYGTFLLLESRPYKEFGEVVISNRMTLIDTPNFRLGVER